MLFSKKPPMGKRVMSQDYNDDFGSTCVCVSL